ncbi:hypothetical protein ACVWWJ_002696 [Luteibacter sp. HA06]
MPLPRRLRRNTHPRHTNPQSDQCADVMTLRDIAGVCDCAARGVDFNMEGVQYTAFNGTKLTRLTLTSLAVLVDSDHDQLLLVPLVLRLGGNIGQVDSAGRTLLHLAGTRKVARHLIGQGVPVNDDMQAPLLAAFAKPPGTGTFDDGMVLGLGDAKGNEPAILTCVRHSTAVTHPFVESKILPPAHWKATLPAYLVAAMKDIGVSDTKHRRREQHFVQMLQDALGAQRYGDVGRLIAANADIVYPAIRHPLNASFSASHELRLALIEHDIVRALRLLASGAEPDVGRFQFEVQVGGQTRTFGELSPLGLAVLLECDAIAHENPIFIDEMDDAIMSLPVSKRSSRFPLLSVFEGFTDFSGVHGAKGATLMHLAFEPAVASWLLDHGAPYDVPNDGGRLPADVLPDVVVPLIGQFHLSRHLPQATESGRGKRL